MLVLALQDQWLIFASGVDVHWKICTKTTGDTKKRLQPCSCLAFPAARKPGSYQWFEIQDNIGCLRTEVKIILIEDLDSTNVRVPCARLLLGNTSYFIPAWRFICRCTFLPAKLDLFSAAAGEFLTKARRLVCLNRKVWNFPHPSPLLGGAVMVRAAGGAHPGCTGRTPPGRLHAPFFR